MKINFTTAFLGTEFQAFGNTNFKIELIECNYNQIFGGSIPLSQKNSLKMAPCRQNLQELTNCYKVYLIN